MPMLPKVITDESQSCLKIGSHSICESDPPVRRKVEPFQILLGLLGDYVRPRFVCLRLLRFPLNFPKWSNFAQCDVGGTKGITVLSCDDRRDYADAEQRRDISLPANNGIPTHDFHLIVLREKL